MQNEPTTMRLKGFWKDRRGNGQKLWYKLGDYIWQLRYALKRAWDGYDDVDVFGFYHRLCERLVVVLTDFHEYHSDIVDEAEIDEVVLKVVDLLGYAVDDERSLHELYPDAPLGDDPIEIAYDIRHYTADQYITATKHSHEKTQEAFNLIGKYLGYLWI